MSIASKRSPDTKVEFRIRQNITIMLLRENIREFLSVFRDFDIGYIESILS